MSAPPADLTDLRNLQAEVREWHEEHFPTCSLASILEKAEEELAELQAAVAAGEVHHRLDEIAEELADVHLTLLAMAARLEIDTAEALAKKFAINRARSPERVRR